MALALVLNDYTWDWPGADRAYRRALALNPGDTFTRFCYTGMLVKASRVDDAIAEAERALDYDPVSTWASNALAYALLCAGRLDDATRHVERAIELDRRDLLPHMFLGVAMAARGDAQGAVGAMQDARSLAPGEPIPEAWLGWAHALAGERDKAAGARYKLERRRVETYTSAALIAIIHIGLGNEEKAFEWFSTALDERDVWLTIIAVWPVFASLHADPRFQDLRRRMKVPVTEVSS